MPLPDDTCASAVQCCLATSCLTSAALRTVRVRSPIFRPFSPAHATSTTLGSEYTTNPYLQQQQTALVLNNICHFQRTYGRCALTHAWDYETLFCSNIDVVLGFAYLSQKTTIQFLTCFESMQRTKW